MSGEHLTREIDEALDEASAWIVRLQDGGSAEEAMAFDAWLEAAEANRQAYDKALAVWVSYGALAPRVLAGVRALEHRKARQLATLWRSPLAMGSMAAAAVAAVAVMIAPQLRPANVQTYATGVGERTAVELADGTHIDLNAATKLTVAYSGHDRQVTLLDGEAIFDVAHDADRPFVITAGDRTVRVLGTRFDVRRRRGDIAVTVARGLVEVRPAGQATGAGYHLRPGQRLDHREGGQSVQLSTVAPEEVFSWRDDRLVFRNQPLGEVIAELNLQFRRPIRLQDPSLAATRISGVLVLDDEDAVVRRLALLAPITSISSDDGVLLRGAAAR